MSDTDDAIRTAVRNLCGQFPGTYWQKKDKERSYPKEFVDALTKSGFLAALIPQQYGGGGLTIREASIIMEEIQRAGCNGGACHAQMYTMGTILRHGKEEQKRKWLPQIANGSLRLQAFAVTEPMSGTDTLNLRTLATKKVVDGKEHYEIRGQKVWTSRAEHSDLMVLLARTAKKETLSKNRTEGLSVFLVDMRDAKKQGLTIRPIETMINHSTTEVFFDDVIVPAENLIGQEGKGFEYILQGMNAERILIAAECIGDAKFFLDKSTAYANEREVFGRKIGQNQGIQFPLAKAYARTEAAQLMVEKACSLFDNNQNCGNESNLAKYLAAEASWEAGEAAMQTFGGFAFASQYNIERKWRETRLYQIAPISTNMILSYIAQHILRLPRSY